MSEAPNSSPASTEAKVPAASKNDSHESAASTETAPVPAPFNQHVVAISLGILSAVLFLTVAGLWIKVNAQTTTILENKNRADQFGSDIGRMQMQMEEAKADSARLQTQVDDLRTRSDRLNTQLEKTRASAADLQIQLDKARAISNGFQSQM